MGKGMPFGWVVGKVCKYSQNDGITSFKWINRMVYIHLDKAVVETGRGGQGRDRQTERETDREGRVGAAESSWVREVQCGAGGGGWLDPTGPPGLWF